VLPLPGVRSREWIAQNADRAHFNLNYVTGAQPRDSRWSAGSDHIPNLQRHTCITIYLTEVEPLRIKIRRGTSQ